MKPIFFNTGIMKDDSTQQNHFLKRTTAFSQGIERDDAPELAHNFTSTTPTRPPPCCRHRWSCLGRTPSHPDSFFTTPNAAGDGTSQL
jgi:hypothetical protein